MKDTRYALITAARNEENFIEKTLDSVVKQSPRPVRWVIVSDASTDRTDAIVRGYADSFGFIELLRLDGKHARNFGAKVQAVSAGYDQLKGMDFQFVGNLDADISLDPDYFRRLLSKFDEDPQLGIAGGFIQERRKGTFAPRPMNNVRSVPHAVQLVRRECYEEIGGYVPLPYGGEDWLAEVTARMKGWRVESYPDLPVRHHRPTGQATGLLLYMFRAGLTDFFFGSDPAFEIVKCLRRVRRHPIGATARWLGFTWANLSGKKRLVSRELMDYLRSEQRARLLAFSPALFRRYAGHTNGIRLESAAEQRRARSSIAPPGRRNSL